jgi:platelet-activating factor acetylhydrolase IB subunit beta/gamma
MLTQNRPLVDNWRGLIDRMTVVRHLSVGAALIFIAIQSTAARSEEPCDEIDRLATTTPAPPLNANRLQLHRQELAAALHSNADIVLLGDSLAELWNTSMLEPYQVLNLGVGGDTTAHVLWRLSAPELENLKPSDVLIILGTNNLGNAKACAVVTGLKRVFERVATLWPLAKITFLEIPPRGDGFMEMNDDRMQVNNSVRHFSGVKTVNVDDAITCGWKQPCANYGVDNLHFTKAGYRIILRAVSPALFGK